MASTREIVNCSSWDGRLTPDTFAIAARAFADNWRRHNQSYPPWSWVPLKIRNLMGPKKEEGYLSLEKICVFRSLESGDEEDNSLNAAADSLEKDELIDHAILVQNQQNEAHYYDFHIVYSASYGVPVLYFRGYCSDGQPVSLDAIEKDLPTCSTSLLVESKWTFITQEEHPYLNRPWFKLHPCGTGEWTKLLFQSGSSNSNEHRRPVELYLVSWFSVVGRVVGLKVPLKMMNDLSCGT
ncbi:PREDICTED: ubiquitin-like-conjugating enzyme ATG10 [Tarenaya hassleriana]|uniref:ubiquitin-like-conjugating enzyme ATG10 n=1 Tax=Tarenaya hassleriana TaxID=28532 RepID=UPI00053C3BE6|nr:PREDICTED: ubiquitin-like-conjugating enzyme ATG10 [Tarenaya hassleriana]XP_010547173.1 PREDICTED: ubiquitin-like-conjugating enzyme ATG10 [Tarenaya hassleriana]